MLPIHIGRYTWQTPRLDVSEDPVHQLLLYGYFMEEIGQQLGVSVRTLRWRNIPTFSTIGNWHLRQIISSINHRFPNGYRFIRGMLRSSGIHVQRDRVESILRLVDPIGARRQLARCIHQRRYTVAHANALWHIDANLKMAKWFIFILGVIDGYHILSAAPTTPQDHT